MPIAMPIPTFEPPTSTPGNYELQNADGSALYRFNQTAVPTNANTFLTPTIKLESAGGSAVQWDTSDGHYAGGTIMFQERKNWANVHDEAEDIGLLIRALSVTPIYLANIESHKRCLLLPSSKRDVMPVRGSRKYGFAELNVYLRPANKDDAADVLRESDS